MAIRVFRDVSTSSTITDIKLLLHSPNLGRSQTHTVQDGLAFSFLDCTSPRKKQESSDPSLQDAYYGVSGSRIIPVDHVGNCLCLYRLSHC